MKKVLTLAALTIMMALPTQAQYNRNGYGQRSPYGHQPHRTQTPPRSGMSRTRGGAAPYVYYGFRGGLTGATTSSDNAFYDAGTMKSGVNIGFNADVMLTPTAPLFFETGLYYTEKGGKQTRGGNKMTYNLNYLEVPLVLKYQYKLDHDLALTPFLGGYLACGVGGKIKNQTLRVAESSFSSDNFSRFDGGIRVGCGLMIDLFYVELGYDAGLANVSQDNFDSAHTGTLFANIGINF